MSDLSAKFTTLEEQLAAQATAIQALVDGVEAALDLINAQLDTQTINNAVNTRALLAAMGANSPCAPCPTPPLTVPVTNPDTRPLNADGCKRAQAFVHALTEIATVLDTMSAFAVPFNPSLIGDAMSQVATALANGDPTPLPSWAEANNIVSAGITYIAGNFFVGGTLVSEIAALAFDIQDATYSAGSAAGAKVAYEAVIDGSGAPSYAKPLLKAMAWNELYTFYFSTTSDVNLAGYDGGICTEVAPTTCFRRISILEDIGGGMRETITMPRLYDNWIVRWPDAPPGDNSVALFADAHPGTHITSAPLTMDSSYRNVGLNLYWFSREGDPYELEFCPPE